MLIGRRFISFFALWNMDEETVQSVNATGFEGMIFPRSMLTFSTVTLFYKVKAISTNFAESRPGSNRYRIILIAYMQQKHIHQENVCCTEQSKLKRRK